MLTIGVTITLTLGITLVTFDFIKANDGLRPIVFLIAIESVYG